MRRLVYHPSLILALWILALCVVRSSAAESTPTIMVSGPTAVAFFPPVTQKELDEENGLYENIFHLQNALLGVERCLAPRQVTVSMEFTRSLVIVEGSSKHHFKFRSDWANAVGIVLVKPGTAPVVVYAPNGPASLQLAAPEAAGKLFSEPKCKEAGLGL